MLKISNLHKSYPIGDSSLHVLKGINLDIEDGEMVSIMGSSGSGEIHIVKHNWNVGRSRFWRLCIGWSAN